MARQRNRNPITTKIAANITAPIPPNYSGMSFEDPQDYIDRLNKDANDLKPGGFMFNAAMLPEEDPAILDAINQDMYLRNQALADAYNQAVQDSGWTQKEEVNRNMKAGLLPETENSYLFGNNVILPKTFSPSEYIAPPDLPKFEEYKNVKTKLNVQKVSRPEKAPRGADPKPTGQINMLNYNKDTRLWEQLQLENAKVGLDDAGGLLTRRGAEGDSFASFSTTPMASVKWNDGKNSITGTQNIGYDGGQSFFKNVARNIAADTYNAFKDAAKNVKINDLNIYGSDNINRVKTWILANNEDNLSSQKLQELRQQAKSQDKPILLYKKKDKQGHTYYEVEAVKEVLFENTKKDGTILYTYYTIDDNGKSEKYDLPIEPTDKTRLDAHFGNKKYKPVLTAKYSTLVDVLTDMVQEASRNGKMKYNVSNNLAPDQRDKIHRAAGRIWGTAILRKLMGGD